MKTLKFWQDSTEIVDDYGYTVGHETKWFCSDGISTYFGDTKTAAAAHFGVPVGFGDVSAAAAAMGRKGGKSRSPRKLAALASVASAGGRANTPAQNAARSRAATAGATFSGVVIFSGEGERGTYRSWPGSHTESRIKARLTRERSHGDRWARAFVPCGTSHVQDSYLEIVSGDELRTIRPEDISE